MSEKVNEQVTSICHDAKCTVFIFILLAWKLHLTNMFEGRIIGVSYETTYPIWHPCYKMIGWFTNTVPCTTVVSSEDSLLENLRQIQREHLEIIEHYQYPIDRILSSTDLAIDAISPFF